MSQKLRQKSVPCGTNLPSVVALSENGEGGTVLTVTGVANGTEESVPYRFDICGGLAGDRLSPLLIYNRHHPLNYSFLPTHYSLI